MDGSRCGRIPPWTDPAVDGYRCGRIPLWTDPAVDGSRREGGGGGADGYPKGFFLLIWITAELGLLSIGGSRAVVGGGGGSLMLDRAFARRSSHPP